MTNEESYPWLQVDLTSPQNVGSITIQTRNCTNCGAQLRDLEVRAGNESNSAKTGKITGNDICGYFAGPSENGRPSKYTITCVQSISARYVTIQMLGSGSLSFNEITVQEPVIDGKQG